MIVEIRLPQWGMSMTEASIGAWHKREGDFVAEGEPLVAVETAKASSDLEAPASGRLCKIFVQSGDVVPVQELLATIDTSAGCAH